MISKLIILTSIIFLGLIFWSCVKSHSHPNTAPVDEAWWNSLSDEWRSILLINQNFSKQGVDIFKVQEQYINRMNKMDEEALSDMNTPLHTLLTARSFNLGYEDFYRRAVKHRWMKECAPIDLKTLDQLDIIYMTNGPGDLSPLASFPHLKILVVNYCGIDNSVPINQQILSLEPIRNLKELKIFYCSSHALNSLEPIRNLVQLEELHCELSNVSSLAPIKKLINLKVLSCGSEIKNAKVISDLKDLEELYVKDCKKLPNMSKLKKLRKLSVGESEMAIVNAGYRIDDIDFLYKLSQLEFLDLYFTSYSGNNDPINQLNKLKAVTCPSSMHNDDVQNLIKGREQLKVINAYEFEF